MAQARRPSLAGPGAGSGLGRSNVLRLGLARAGPCPARRAASECIRRPTRGLGLRTCAATQIVSQTNSHQPRFNGLTVITQLPPPPEPSLSTQLAIDWADHDPRAPQNELSLRHNQPASARIHTKTSTSTTRQLPACPHLHRRVQQRHHPDQSVPAAAVPARAHAMDAAVLQSGHHLHKGSIW